ncbi:MAG: Dyp-type peroxidase [Microbacteriaceae bacterium]
MSTAIMSTMDMVDKSKSVSRRGLFLGGAAIGLGTAAGFGTERYIGFTEQRNAEQQTVAAYSVNGPRTVPFYGEHQAGIEIIPQTHQSLLALNLNPGVGKTELRRLLAILSDDAARLTQGTHALADSEPELAQIPARLTITFGFARRLVDIVRPQGGAPSWLQPLPSFGIDRLRDEWNGGDLLLQIASDDPLSLAHAQRMLLKDARSFGTIKWIQSGFRHSHGSETPNRTQRNLFGQLDGTVNPTPGSADFRSLVWEGQGSNPSWLDGGTGMVVRRIEMQLDKWDHLDRPGREQSVGRTLKSGAPLTGFRENDEPDFEARNALGFPVIPEFAHIRRARSADPNERFYRRVYNYDLTPESSGAVSNSGLIFSTFQHDIAKQYTPIQHRLDQLDLLNEWTTPIGSAVFAIPPGCQPGGFIGETLF